MNTIEKNKIYKQIDEIDDIEVLDKVSQFISIVNFNSRNVELLELTPEEAERIDFAYEQSLDESKLIDNEDIKRKYWNIYMK